MLSFLFCIFSPRDHIYIYHEESQKFFPPRPSSYYSSLYGNNMKLLSNTSIQVSGESSFSTFLIDFDETLSVLHVTVTVRDIEQTVDLSTKEKLLPPLKYFLSLMVRVFISVVLYYTLHIFFAVVFF